MDPPHARIFGQVFHASARDTINRDCHPIASVGMSELRQPLCCLLTSDDRALRFGALPPPPLSLASQVARQKSYLQLQQTSTWTRPA